MDSYPPPPGFSKMGSSFDDNANSQPNDGTQFEEIVDRLIDVDEETRPPIKKLINYKLSRSVGLFLPHAI